MIKGSLRPDARGYIAADINQYHPPSAFVVIPVHTESPVRIPIVKEGSVLWRRAIVIWKPLVFMILSEDEPQDWRNDVTLRKRIETEVGMKQRGEKCDLDHIREIGQTSRKAYCLDACDSLFDTLRRCILDTRVQEY